MLKAPQIGGHIAAFANVFPEAHFVITDRDPYRCVVSAAVMVESIIAPFGIDNPLADDGARDRRVLAMMRHKLAELGAFSRARPERVTHVAYPRLVNDPTNTVRHVFSAVDVPTNEELFTRVERFLDAQRSGARAVPPRELPTMGYDHDHVLSDRGIGEYCRAFGIEPELSRLTGTQPSA